MSTEGLALPFFNRDEQDPSKDNRSRYVQLFERYTPSQGWATFVFLLLTLLIVGNSVTSADWTETPGLILIIFLGVVTGLLLSKVRIHAIFLHLAALVIGFVLVVWQSSSLIEGEPITEQVRQMWNRVTDFADAATAGGISTDLLPVTLALLTFAWVLGYVSSWFIFRSNNVWFAVVLSGTAMLTNLSFLPDVFASRFFLFMFFAMLLIVRMSVIQRHEMWRKVQIGFSPSTGWLTIHAAAWFTVAVLILAAVLPMNVVVSRTVADLWKAGRTPLESLEDDFARLFSGIPSRKDLAGRLFGTTLPFLGKISFDGDVVFWADSEYPSYWLNQTYSEYTSAGWIAGQTETLKIGPNTLPPARSDGLKREPVEQTLQLQFSTSRFLSGGSFDWVSQDAKLGALRPKQFAIDLQNDETDSAFPQDIQELAKVMREQIGQSSTPFVESIITSRLPSDLVLISVTPDLDQRGPEGAELVVLERKAPIAPEIVTWKFDDGIEEGEAYTMVSYVSLATDEDLKNADTQYDRFFTDHYLQLPESLPQRVRDKAIQLTASEETPFEKVIAIQDYLRGPEFTYSQDIDPPPAGSDGVDNFIFETKIGYSDYFASSLAVMARAAGVPTRMAAGYSPGEEDPESGRKFVRDYDSHGWVQVYFPEFGWIDFEPTPRWPIASRQLRGSEAFGTPVLPVGDDTPLDPFDDDLSDPGGESIDFEEPLGEGGFLPSIDYVWWATKIGIGVGAVVVVWLLFRTIWNLGLGKASPVEKAYAKMGRLGAIAGVRRRSQYTPMEYAWHIGAAVPSVADAASHIATAFAVNRYGHKETSDEEHEEVEHAWRSMRFGLLGYAFGRLNPAGRGSAG